MTESVFFLREVSSKDWVRVSFGQFGADVETTPWINGATPFDTREAADGCRTCQFKHPDWFEVIEFKEVE